MPPFCTTLGSRRPTAVEQFFQLRLCPLQAAGHGGPIEAIGRARARPEGPPWRHSPSRPNTGVADNAQCHRGRPLHRPPPAAQVWGGGNRFFPKVKHLGLPAPAPLANISAPPEGPPNPRDGSGVGPEKNSAHPEGQGGGGRFVKNEWARPGPHPFWLNLQ